MKKKLTTILSLVLIITLLATSFSFAFVKDAGFYERIADQSLAAAENAASVSDKLFYYMSALYDYSFTEKMDSVLDTLGAMEKLVADNPADIAVNSEMIAEMVQSSGDKLFEKQEYETAITCYESAATLYGNYGSNTKEIEYCNSQITKCSRSMKADTIILICLPIVAVIIVVAFIIVAKKTKPVKKTSKKK